MAHSIGAQKVKYRLPPGLLKSPIQHITVTIAAGQTVGSTTLPRGVNPLKTALLGYGGQRSAEATLNPAEDFARVTLSGNVVTATRNTANASDSVILQVGFAEFKPWVVEKIIYDTVTSSANTQADKTITSVNTARAFPIYLGQSTDRTTYNYIRDAVVLQLQAATNIRINRGNFTAGDNITVGFCVVEFKPGIINLIQSALVSVAAGGTSSTASITAVDMNATLCVCTGFQQTVLGVDDKRHWPYIALTATDTLTATINTLHASSVPQIRVYVIEFKRKWVKSVTRGVTTIASGDPSATGVIAVKDTPHTLISHLRMTTNTSSTSDAPWTTAAIASKTAVTLARGSSPATTATTSWEAFEFQ